MDRNFCNNNVIKELDSCGIPYVIMVPFDVYGHKSMVDKHAKDLMDNPDLIIEDGLSGITEKTQIFKNSEYEAYINLIYDDVNGAKRREVFRKKIYEEKKRLEKLISEGKNPDVSKELSEYIEINEDNNVNIIHENYNEELRSKGMSSILTKEDYGADKAQEKYSLRNSSCEGQFNIIKNQLGYDTLRSHTPGGIIVRLFIAFLAAIIRNELFKIGRTLKINTNTLIAKICNCKFLYHKNGQYSFVDDVPEILKKFFDAIGVSREYINSIATLVTGWKFAIPPRGFIHPNPTSINSDIQPKRKRGRPRKNENLNNTVISESTTDNTDIKRKRGRPRKIESAAAAVNSEATTDESTAAAAEFSSFR